MQLERKISFGDIITSVAVIVSALSLTWELAKHRDLDRKQQANEIRSSAAKTLAGLERWKNISLLIFEECQPLYVLTSERFKTSDDLVSARDYLYRSMIAAHLTVHQKLLDEKVEVSYVELFKYHPSIKVYFEIVINALNEREKYTFSRLLIDTQNRILSAESNEVKKNTAILGNDLREAANTVQIYYVSQINKILNPVEEYLSSLVLKSDRELLASSNLRAPDLNYSD
jgi:hypothetical protein